MIKPSRSYRQKRKKQQTRKIKVTTVIFSAILFGILTATLIVFLSAPTTSSAQTTTPPAAQHLVASSAEHTTPFSIHNANAFQQIKPAASKTQFNLYIAYAYEGKAPANDSYIATNGANMTMISQYPSVIVINSTRLPGNQIASCDAEVELYYIQLTSNTGLMEHFGYYMGTNYNPSFSCSQLTSLTRPIYDAMAPYNFTYISGNFEINMTDNTSILSNPIGSVDCFSDVHNDQGLWNAGKPDALSVNIYRIGYLTITNGTVIYYTGASNEAATSTMQINAYGDGFLHNALKSTNELPQPNLFHPIGHTAIIPKS